MVADRIDADLSRFPQADAGAEAADSLGGRDGAGLDVARDADCRGACRHFLAFSLRAGKPA